MNLIKKEANFTWLQTHKIPLPVNNLYKLYNIILLLFFNKSNYKPKSW